MYSLDLNNLISNLKTIFDASWPALQWILEVLVKILVLYTIVAAFFLEHELIHKLVPGVRRTMLGRVIIFLGNSFKKFLILFGFSFYRPSLVEQWAGLYEDEERHPLIQTDVGQEASNICAKLTSKTFGNHRIYLKGAEGSGTRQIALEAFRIFSNDKREVFYFDCSAIPSAELHMRFIYNIGAWAGAAEIVSAAESDSSDRHRVEDFVSAANIRAFLKNYKQRTANKPIVIILDVERLLDVKKEADVYLKTEEILRVIISSRYSTALVTGSIDLEETFKLRFRLPKVIRSIGKKIGYEPEEYPGFKMGNFRFFVNREYDDLFPNSSFSEIRKDPMKLDELHVLLTLIENADVEQQRRILNEFNNWRSDTFAQALIEKVTESIIRDGTWHHNIHQEGNGEAEHKSDARRLLAVLSLFDTPVPVTGITRLWTACKLPFNSPSMSPEQVILLDEPVILQKLIHYGLVQRLHRSGQLFLHPVYVVRPGFRRDGLRYLQGDELLSTAASRVVDAILSDLRPPGITATSKYISQSEFGATRGLLGYLRHDTNGDELIVPLPSAVCDVISAIQRHPIFPQLETYSWPDRGGAKHTDLVAVISPTTFSVADRVCRVGVHIVSREGTGRAVQNALQPYVDIFLDVEGDAYRFGPGGYLELLVQLKSAEEINRNERISQAFKAEHNRDKSRKVTLRTLIKHIEDEIQKTLRANIDDKATVQLVLGTNEEVVEDWKENAGPFPARIELETSTESIYGTTSRYSLVARPPAYDAILGHLKKQTGRDEITGVIIQCIYSYTTLQVFFVFKALNLQERVWARIVGADNLAQERVTLSFMEVFERRKLNLDTLKHGPDGSYIADFEVPVAPYGVQQPAYNAALLTSIKDALKEKQVNISFMHSPVLTAEDQESENVVPNSKQKRFAQGKPMAAENFDYVADPEIFHRYMRKHLFIPDSDAAIVAIAQNFLSDRGEGEYRVLEIGSGTGALTAKLIQAGIKNIDTLEPDETLSQYWERLKAIHNLDQYGEHYCSSLEEFANAARRTYDLIVSQGVHHHIPTSTISSSGDVEDNNYRLTFLESCRSILNNAGIYIVSDEFLVDYNGDEKARLENLDQWYRCVISTALADGYSELADLEYRFWLNDRHQTVEYKESIEEFESRIKKAGSEAPFDVKSIVRFGMTKDYGGGFGVLVLKPRILKTDLSE